jgi:hypothetical protein
MAVGIGENTIDISGALGAPPRVVRARVRRRRQTSSVHAGSLNSDDDGLDCAGRRNLIKDRPTKSHRTAFAVSPVRQRRDVCTRTKEG